MDKKPQIIEEYSDESLEYESIRFKGGGALIDKLQKEIVFDFLKPVKGMKVLDVATGTGRFAIELARNGADVTACDLSDNMLEVGKKNAIKNRVKVNFEKADVESLKYKNDMFDIAIGIRIIMHLQNPEKGLKEMGRVTKRYGYIVFEIPNKISLWAKLNKIFKLRRKEIKKFHPNYASKGFSYLEIENILKKYGMEIIGTRSLFWVPETIYYICPKSLTPFIEKIEKIFGKILPIKFAENIFIKAKRI